MKKLLFALLFAAVAWKAYAATISLQSYTGHWLCAEGGGGQSVYANRSSVGSWEAFTLTDLNGGALESGDPVVIQAANGQYFCAEGGGGQNVVANRDGIGGWEVFTILKQNGGGSINNGDAVAFQSYNGQYWCAENGGGDVVNANRDWINGWETFTFVTDGANNGGGAGTPQVSFSPSATSVQSGQTVYFSVSASCSGGLNEIGLEGCDSGGNPTVNLGAVGASGSSSSYTFSWTAPSPGTYYFDAYGWNVDRSQLTRAAVITVTVVAVPGVPQVTFSPSSTSVQTGQTVNFSVSVSCSSGLNEIGLEGCDSNGNPAVNLGAIGVSGTSASHAFSWQAPSPGTYYFDAYGWNADRSQLTRAAVVAVTVADTGAPQVTFSPSSTSVQPGQMVSFSVSASCASGLNEIGLEGCDGNGNPVANLGLVGASGTSASYIFSWQAPGAGTYYFDAYGWNVDRSQLTRTAVVAVTVADAPGTATAPQVSMSASSTSIHPGQGVDFTVFASCSSGLSEIGFEECDASGAALSNEGAVGVTGTSVNHLFSWVTPEKADYFDSSSYSFWATAPGTFYFRAYGWNADCTGRGRSAIITITVTQAINTMFEGWVCQSYYAPLEQTAWYAFDPRTEGGIYCYGALPDVPAPSDDWGDFLGIMELIESERDARDQQLDAEIGAAQRARLKDQVERILASGKGVQFVNEFGQIVGTKPPPSSGLPATGWMPPGSVSWNGWTTRTVYPYSGTPSGDIVRLPAFIVDGNNPATFDWDGYFAWYRQNNIPVPARPGGYLGAGAAGTGEPPANTPAGMLGKRTTRNAFPFLQSTNTACGVAVARNIVGILKGACTESELSFARRMAKIANEPLDEFLETPKDDLKDGHHGLLMTVTQLNEAFEQYNIIVGPAGNRDPTQGDLSFYSGLDAFKALMKDAADKGQLFVAATRLKDMESTDLDTNHVVVIKPYYSADGRLKMEVIDSGRPKNGFATTDSFDLSVPSQLLDAARIPTWTLNNPPVPNEEPKVREPMSGRLYPVKLKP